MSQLRTPRQHDTLERSRFFPQQVIAPQDLAQDSDYLLHRLRRHNRLLHGWGIALGLQVQDEIPISGPAYDAFVETYGTIPPDVTASDQTWIVVLPGYAITPIGDEIYLPKAIFLNTAEELDGALVTRPPENCGHLIARKMNRVSPKQTSPDRTFYLVADAFESEIRPIGAANCRCGDHPDSFEFSRIRDTLRFRLVETIYDPYKPDELHLKLLRGCAKRDYICLGTIKFSQSPKPMYSYPGRDPSLDGTTSSPHPPPDPNTPPVRASQTVRPSKPGRSSETAVITEPRAENPEQTSPELASSESPYPEQVDSTERYRKYLRPEGIELVNNGISVEEVPATHLNYGAQKKSIEKFLSSTQMNVGQFAREPEITRLIEKYQGKEIGRLLELAWKAAARLVPPQS